MTLNPARKSGGLSAANRTERQLLQELVCLKADLEREREEKKLLQLQRDHMLGWRGTVEEKLEEAEAKLRNICKEKQEAEERHQVEISVYKQKLKQILSHQQNTSPHNPLQNQNLQSRGVEKRLQEALTLNHQVELMERSNDYNRRLRDVEVRFDLKMKSLMEEQDRRRAAALRRQKKEAWSHMASLMEEHSRALRGEEELRSAAQEELQEAQQLIKELSAAQEKNQGVQEAQQELQRRLQEEVADLHSMLKEAQEELRDLKEENKLLLQGFCKVQQERDQLLRRQEQSMADLQRRSTLKKELLDRKLLALSRFLERKEAQLLVAPSPPADDLPVSGAEVGLNDSSSGEELEAPSCSSPRAEGGAP
ncbi:growth arrest-specific protein 8 isoform X1 [Oryzias latipes]|uniref:growth arrest-specific protein 8 isoform X1 n=1 Tax=Oryzias latipes TaxID=8090 RepID=UPI0002A4CBB8|nr:growth arrest-specific protein 8 isoform X1 [Oryzias latipes]